MLIAADRFLKLAEQVMNVAEAVPGEGCHQGAAGFLSQSQGLLAVGEPSFGVALLGFDPADGVEGSGEASKLIFKKLEQFARSVRMAERLFAVVHEVQQTGEVQVSAGLATDVLKLGEQIKAAQQVAIGIVVSSEPREGAAETALSVRLGLPLAGLLSGRPRDSAVSGQVTPPGGLVKCAGQRDRELACVHIEAEVRG